MECRILFQRAGAVRAEFYCNDAAEATYPQARADSTGQPLDGSKHKYTLMFGSRPVSIGKRVLVSDDVRREESIAD